MVGENIDTQNSKVKTQKLLATQSAKRQKRLGAFAIFEFEF
jgi:hypothetical protein